MSRPLVITCKTCGRTDVPDWGDGNCITCARDAVLEHPAHDNQGSQPPYAPAAAHDTPEQRLEAALEKILDDHGHAGANGANRKQTNAKAVAAILAAVTAELRAIIPDIQQRPEFGPKRNGTDQAVRRAYNRAINDIISKAKERGLL